MSTNSIRFHCTGCDYEYLEHFQPITLKCQIGDDVATYHRSTDWCNQCDSIRYVEYIPAIEELQHEYDELVSEPPEQYTDNIFARTLEWMCDKLEKNKRPKFDAKKSHAEEISKISNQITWRQARTAPPHCLTCGTTDITHITYEHVGDMTIAKNFRHSCGGLLVRDHNDDPGIRFHFRESVLWMDIEGNRLHDVEMFKE